MVVDAAELRRGSTALSGFLGLFGGDSDEQRTNAVLASANIGIELANDSNLREAIVDCMRAILVQPQVQRELGNQPGERAMQALSSMIILGAFCARTTLDEQISQQLRDTIVTEFPN